MITLTGVILSDSNPIAEFEALGSEDIQGWLDRLSKVFVL